MAPAFVYCAYVSLTRDQSVEGGAGKLRKHKAMYDSFYHNVYSNISIPMIIYIVWGFPKEAVQKGDNDHR